MSFSPALDSRIDDVAGRLKHLEMRAARERDFDDNGPIAANDNFLATAISSSSEVKNLTSAFRGQAVVKITGENAAITSANTTVGAGRSQGTSLVPGHRVPEIVAPYERQLTIRDLLGAAVTASNSIEFPKETSFTNAAAPVAETTAKPYSDITFDLVSTPVRTLAHLFKISRQILDDGPALAAYVGRRGTYGLKSVEQAQLLNGSGSGQNLFGIIPQATAYETARTEAGDTPLDILNHAISQAEEADLPVTGIVLSKADWRKIVGQKDLGGNYISTDSPFGLTAPQLWNLPVVATNALPAGTFLTGAFKDGATIFDRLEVEVLLSTENVDDFERNMATVRIEERLALAVFRPDAFITGSFA